MTETAWDQQQLELIRRTCCPAGVPDEEFQRFIAVAKAKGLDPLQNQIYLIERKAKDGGKKYTIQTSIEAFRMRAESTGQYAPGREPSFSYDPHGMVTAATAFVKKRVGDDWHETGATAFWSEFAQLYPSGDPTPMWERMPRLMLAKCAEAQALRRAFPGELGGLYTADEMMQADSPANGDGHRNKPTPQAAATRTANPTPAPSPANSSTPQTPAAATQAAAARRVELPKAEGEVVTSEHEPRAVEGCWRIQQVLCKKTGASSKGPWSAYAIGTYEGDVFETFSKEHAVLALRAMQDGVPVQIKSEEGKYGVKLLGIVPVPAGTPAAAPAAPAPAAPAARASGLSDSGMLRVVITAVEDKGQRMIAGAARNLWVAAVDAEVQGAVQSLRLGTFDQAVADQCRACIGVGSVNVRYTKLSEGQYVMQDIIPDTGDAF